MNMQAFIEDVIPTHPAMLADAARDPGLGHADRAVVLLAMLSEGRDLADMTLALIGWDALAASLARRAITGFGMSVVVFGDGATAADLPDGAEWSDDLDEALASADVVSLHGAHVPGAPPVMTAARMHAMRPDALLMNVGDAGLVNEMALAQALWFETIGGAGLDLTRRATPLSDDLKGCDALITLPLISKETHV